MKKIIYILIIFLILTSTIFVNANEEEHNTIIERAKILSVSEIKETDISGFDEIFVEIEILTGELKGTKFEIIHALTGSFAYDIMPKQGDKILVIVDELVGGKIEVYIKDYIRDTYVYLVLALFVALILLVGRKTGLKALITIALTIGLVIKFLLPGMLKGYSPILLTILTCFVVTIITILLVGGLTKKSVAAIVGVLGGVLSAGIITYVVGSQVKLTGLSGEEATMLMFIPQNIDFDFRGLLFSGIILGALGAVMDVGMSIASSMEEVKKANPLIEHKELIKAGMCVGRDIMGTMSNTLILAYTGSAIPLILLFMAYDVSFIEIINLDIIASEIIRAFAGTIGLILTVPITAVCSGILYKNSKQT
ncbi:MAG: YibE/F family protein [Alkaliphilus sp.]